jgi:hypothetical protein
MVTITVHRKLWVVFCTLWISTLIIEGFFEDIFWPRHFSNEQLYKLAGTTTIRKDIWERKLAYLGRALRQPRNAPARECMEQYFRHLDEAPRIRGTPMNLPRELRLALGLIGMRFQSWGDLWSLRLIAEKGDGSWNGQIVKPVVDRLLETAAAEEHMRRDKRQHYKASRKRSLQEASMGPEEPALRWRICKGKRRQIRDRGSAGREPRHDTSKTVHAGMAIRLTMEQGRWRLVLPQDYVTEPTRSLKRYKLLRLSVDDRDPGEIAYWSDPRLVLTLPTQVAPSRGKRRRTAAEQRRVFVEEQTLWPPAESGRAS